jgi:microcystin-dependent protein
MSSPFVGECRLVGFNFAPNGWMLCQGQLLPISEYETLFVLIGTTYGGDGQQTFGLPDLRGRMPIDMGTGPGGVNFTIGQNGGVESVTLSVNQIPAHSHALLASSDNGSSNLSQNSVLSASPTKLYVATSATKVMNNAAITPAGGSQPHDNLQPYLTLSWCISLFGVFPSMT